MSGKETAKIYASTLKLPNMFYIVRNSGKNIIAYNSFSRKAVVLFLSKSGMPEFEALVTVCKKYILSIRNMELRHPL